MWSSTGRIFPFPSYEAVPPSHIIFWNATMEVVCFSEAMDLDLPDTETPQSQSPLPTHKPVHYPEQKRCS